MARLIDCMAVMYSLSDNRASPGLTEQDQEKKSPAIKAVVVTVTSRVIIAMFIRFELAFTSFFFAYLNPWLSASDSSRKLQFAGSYH